MKTQAIRLAIPPLDLLVRPPPPMPLREAMGPLLLRRPDAPWGLGV